MAKETFTWLLRSCYTRAGVFLETGKTYSAKSVSPDVLAEWERTGAIKREKTSTSTPKKGD